jgi:hypothetical protein
MFRFLERVDESVFARVRAVMNHWFAAVSDDRAERLRGRLKAQNSHFEGAYFELLLHAAYVATGVTFIYEPGEAMPDFLLPTAYELEATTISEDPGTEARNQRLGTVWNTLNDVPPEWFNLTVRRVEDGSGTPRATQLRRDVIRWLADLDWEEASRLAAANRPEALPTKRFPLQDGWAFTFKAIPRRRRNTDPQRRLIAIGEATSVWGDPSSIRKRLSAKVGAKRDATLPYVIAINSARHVSHEEVFEALFGDEAVALVTDEDDESAASTVFRRGDGLFQPSRNTRVSAVLFTRSARPWRLPPPEDVRLYVNPWAALPLDPELIPWATACAVNGAGHLVTASHDLNLPNVLGLGQAWPGSPWGGSA